MTHATSNTIFRIATVCSLFLFALVAQLRAEGTPTIEYSEMEWNFGDVNYKDPAEHTFIVYNKGTALLKITDVQRSCGCTEPILDSREIPPGGKANLKVAYDTTRKGPFDKTVTITSNDPAKEKTYIKIRGNVRTEVEVDPMRLHYGTIYRDEDNSRDVKVTSQTVKDLTITSIESDNEFVTYENKGRQEDGSLLVKVNVSKSVPIGNLRANLKFMVNSEKMPVLDLPVVAQVFGGIEINPPRLYFSPRNSGEIQDSAVTVKDRKNTGTFKITNITDSQGLLEFTTEAVKEGSEYRIVAKTKKAPTLESGAYFSGDVVITTNVTGEETLTVPFNGYVLQPQPAGEAGQPAIEAPKH